MMNERLLSFSFIIFFEHRHFPINDTRDVASAIW